MPQPLQSLTDESGRRWELSLDALEREPELALLFAKAVVGHSQIEEGIGAVLIAILDAHAAPGYTMFNALSSTSARISVLKAVADEHLSGTDLAVFSIAITLARRMAKARNRLVHWRWGTCDQVPESLVACPPIQLHSMQIAQDNMQRLLRGGSATPENMPEVLHKAFTDVSHMLVYRQADFESLINDLKDVNMLFTHLRFMISPFDIGVPKNRLRADLLRKILKIPLVREERKTIRERRLRQRERSSRTAEP